MDPMQEKVNPTFQKFVEGMNKYSGGSENCPKSNLLSLVQLVNQANPIMILIV